MGVARGNRLRPRAQSFGPVREVLYLSEEWKVLCTKGLVSISCPDPTLWYDLLECVIYTFGLMAHKVIDKFLPIIIRHVSEGVQSISDECLSKGLI